MTIQLKRLIQTASLLAAVASSTTAQAGFMAYTDAIAWNNAVGAVSGTEDFNAFAAGTVFHNTALEANNMRIQVTSSDYNLVIGLPNTGFSIDGSPYAMAVLRNPDFMRIDFDTAVSAWGANFLGLGNELRNTSIKAFDKNDNLLGTITGSAPNNIAVSFYGFAFDAAETAAYLTIQNQSNLFDAFSIDNVQYVTPSNTPVSNTPLPPALALFATGLLGLAGLGRKKQS